MDGRDMREEKEREKERERKRERERERERERIKELCFATALRGKTRSFWDISNHSLSHELESE